MTEAALNASLDVAQTSLTLEGLRQLSAHRLILFPFLLLAFVFALCSDSLVLLVICARRGLHRPMFVFVAALLLNSALGSSTIYPRLLWELLWEDGSVRVTLSACVGQAWVIYSLGAASFLLLAAMAFDRYVAICLPLRYAALLSPRAVAAALLCCWLIPAVLVGGAVLIAARAPHCRAQINRLYCDVYSLIRLGCGGNAAKLGEFFALFTFTATVLLPAAFVIFSYSCIFFVCLCRARASSGKALRTCLPHLLVFLNYSACSVAEVLWRRLQAAHQPASSVVLNPVVYGLNMDAITAPLRRLLGRVAHREAPGKS
uniref:Olfactory receptor n=1 Tax=Cyprinodon variegatus TaxID=28743 RepID=A0A3Q2CQP2_CYPVA